MRLERRVQTLHPCCFCSARATAVPKRWRDSRDRALTGARSHGFQRLLSPTSLPIELKRHFESHDWALLGKAEPKAVFLLVHIDVQARPQLVSGIQTHVLGKRNSNIIRRRDKVPVAEQVHAEQIAFHEEAG